MYRPPTTAGDVHIRSSNCRNARAGHATYAGADPEQDPVDHRAVVVPPATTLPGRRKMRLKPHPLRARQITPPHAETNEPASWQSMSFLRTATDRVTSRVAVRVSTAVVTLLTGIVNTRRFAARPSDG